MRFVEEIVVDDFLPTFRSMLAEALREEGLTQSEVADLLGISQSAVSKYVHGAVERNEALLESEHLQDHVAHLATGLASGDLSPVQALVETEVLIRELEEGGLLADLHADAVPELAEHDQAFAVHDPESRLRQAEQVRSSVRRGLRILENTGGVTQLIPAVGSNLVECLPEAESIEDVAAVPGRILDVKGRPTIPAAPEFGVSQHVANVLLAARAVGSDARAASNLAYDPDLLDALEVAGHTTVEFDADTDMADGIATALADRLDADVLYQTGAHGVEPIVYVLGPDAPTVAGAVRDATT
jgi:predicted fused transcriptional regulator/phosphomethylpyrimidine kinase/predicted transcriptional regulator